MPDKITTYEWLRQTISSLDDDPTKDWREYPCIEWPFSTLPSGRPQMTIKQRPQSPTRVAYSIQRGAIPEHHELVRRCTSVRCVRPIHFSAEISRYHYVLNALSELTDDLSADWRSYPCLKWPFPPAYPSGYGGFRLNDKLIRAHRFAYEFSKGPIPGDLHVCHHCDVPACFRPVHLFAGSDKDNSDDKISKGRSGTEKIIRPKGASHPLSRFTESDIVEMRHLFSGGMPKREIARKFGTSGTHVRKIVRRELWTHI